MRYSQVFPKTNKSDPKDSVAINHKLLVRGGFIDQLMAGSWTLLPLGLRVIAKINNIIREEINATGALELALPLVHPKEIWNETGRWDAAKEVMYQFKDTREKEFALSFTHEEIMMDLVRKHLQSYEQLPLKLYQFSTKFRNEPRATSGILRGREFLMKDLYSLHENEEDLMAYYDEVRRAYLRIFERIGLNVIVCEASGGVFTEKHTHEFQVLADSGEDTIHYCPKCQIGFNKEVWEESMTHCRKCDGELVTGKSIEVGNIFPLGIKYSEKMGCLYTSSDGSKSPAWFGSYGIGPTRVMGTTVEVSHDDKGIVWPETIAPFKYHLIEVSGKQLAVSGEEVYKRLNAAGKEVLWDDREDVSMGQKFADADLIGCPNRLVISEKLGDKVETKERVTGNIDVVNVDELLH